MLIIKALILLKLVNTLLIIYQPAQEQDHKDTVGQATLATTQELAVHLKQPTVLQEHLLAVTLQTRLESTRTLAALPLELLEQPMTETLLKQDALQQLQAAQPTPGCKTHQHQEQDAVVMMDLVMIPTTDQQTHPQPHL